MIYTDSELTKWWKALSPSEKDALFEDLGERVSDSARSFVESLQEQYWRKVDFSSKQLAAIRKFMDNMS